MYRIKKERGITLIALVITIIVMLILAAVTISMAVNGGLFGYAGNAVKDTENKKNKEMNWAGVEQNLLTNQLIDKFTKEEAVIETFIWTGLYGSETPQVFQFEHGMTWERWIESSYNPYRGDDSKFNIQETNGTHLELVNFGRMHYKSRYRL